MIGTYKTGHLPQALVFDGQNIWVANQGDFAQIMPELIMRPILSHPGSHIVDHHQQWHVDAISTVTATWW